MRACSAALVALLGVLVEGALGAGRPAALEAQAVVDDLSDDLLLRVGLGDHHGHRAGGARQHLAFGVARQRGEALRAGSRSTCRSAIAFSRSREFIMISEVSKPI
jgi:hypothetical protein